MHVTPSTSGDRVPSEASNNRLLPPDANAPARELEKPPHSSFPRHRRKCVSCGCPALCCSGAGFALWILALLLVMGVPVAVLYLDHHYSAKFGSTLSRYSAVRGTQLMLCRTLGIYSVNITGQCADAPVTLPCLKFKVIVYPSDAVRPVVNSTFLLKSEREFVIPNQWHYEVRGCRLSEATWGLGPGAWGLDPVPEMR